VFEWQDWVTGKDHSTWVGTKPVTPFDPWCLRWTLQIIPLQLTHHWVCCTLQNGRPFLAACPDTIYPSRYACLHSSNNFFIRAVCIPLLEKSRGRCKLLHDHCSGFYFVCTMDTLNVGFCWNIHLRGKPFPVAVLIMFNLTHPVRRHDDFRTCCVKISGATMG